MINFYIYASEVKLRSPLQKDFLAWQVITSLLFTVNVLIQLAINTDVCTLGVNYLLYVFLIDLGSSSDDVPYIF